MSGASHPIVDQRESAPLSDDTELLNRALSYDSEALGRIHDAYYPALFRYIAFRVGDRHTAEDLTSEVFTRFLGALRGGRPPQSTLRGWLFGVAANVVTDHHRRHFRAPSAPLDDQIVSPEASPHEQAEGRADREDLRRAMASLTDEQQNVLALRFGQELPIQAVASTLGKSEGAIKQLQARAIAALARVLAPGRAE